MKISRDKDIKRESKKARKYERYSNGFGKKVISRTQKAEYVIEGVLVNNK